MKVAEERIKSMDGKQERLDRVSEVLQALHENRFTGYIKINFTQGSVGRVEKFEEILRRGSI